MSIKTALRPMWPMSQAKQRVKRLQQLYWCYFRPLYCQLIPTPPASRVLVLAPHIDDDVIGCGGVLRQHVSNNAVVTAVYMRQGGPQRESEARDAASVIGTTNLVFLRWGPPPSNGRRWHTVPTTKAEISLTDRFQRDLAEVLDQYQPEVVCTPFFLDPHPDHATATHVLRAAMAIAKTSVETCYLYEVWTPLVPNVVVNISEEAEIKRRAINAHRSQVERMNLDLGILGLNAYRAEMNRLKGYAEAYLRLRPEELAEMLRAAGEQSGGQ